MRLRTMLVLLVVIAIVPMGAFAAGLVTVFAGAQARALEQGTYETASALAVAVYRELDAAIASLETLAGSPSLDGLDVDSFRFQAERIRQQHPGWDRLVLTDATGRVLLDTGAELDREISIGDRPYFQQAVHGQRPSLSDLLLGRISNRPIIAVAVPVVRNGEVRRVLVVAVDPAALAAPLATFDLTLGQAFRLFDRNRTTIARFPPDRAAIGAEAGPMFAAIQAGSREDWVRFDARTGQTLYAANVPLPEYGWLVSFTVSADEIDGPWRASMLLIAGGGLGLLVVSLFAAMLLGRRIERPMSALARQAEAMGRGDAVDTHPVGVREIDEVASALATASQELAARAEERARYEAELADRAEALARADRLKDEFLATLSHELRSPLNAIVGWTRMLKVGAAGDTAAQARALDVIERNARIQEQLIGDLLEISRIVTGRLRLDAQPLPLNPVLQAAVDVVSLAAEAKGVTIETAFDAQTATVLGDASRLQQAFWNLLSNALKFTPRGGRVLLRAVNVNSHLEISVTDTGEGIPPEFLPHVFERFRQSESALNRRHGGLGLGLSIVRHIVELHGGKVRAASDGIGRGAQFTIELPTLAVLPVRHPDQPQSLVLPPLLDGLTVLVVEDDPDSRQLVATVLAQAGASTMEAASAADAWSVLARDRIDVVVCDISMPGEDGYSLIRRLRGSGLSQVCRTPAAALTAQARPEDRTRALTAGFQAHIPKPVHADELIATVAMLAGRADVLLAGE